MTSRTSTRNGASSARSELAPSDCGRPSTRPPAASSFGTRPDPKSWGPDPYSSGRDSKSWGQALAVRDVTPFGMSGSTINLSGHAVEPAPLEDPRRRRDGVFHDHPRRLDRQRRAPVDQPRP